jgi:hypothetical protein
MNDRVQSETQQRGEDQHGHSPWRQDQIDRRSCADQVTAAQLSNDLRRAEHQKASKGNFK